MFQHETVGLVKEEAVDLVYLPAGIVQHSLDQLWNPLQGKCENLRTVHEKVLVAANILPFAQRADSGVGVAGIPKTACANDQFVEPGSVGAQLEKHGRSVGVRRESGSSSGIAEEKGDGLILGRRDPGNRVSHQKKHITLHVLHETRRHPQAVNVSGAPQINVQRIAGRRQSQSMMKHVAGGRQQVVWRLSHEYQAGDLVWRPVEFLKQSGCTDPRCKRRPGRCGESEHRDFG